MKKLLFVLLTAVFVLAAQSSNAKALNVLNINKGELPDDTSECQASLSEENALKEGDFTLKVEFAKMGWCGQYTPKKASWGGFKKFKFIAFNPSDKPIKDVGVCLKGAKMSNGPENRKDFKLELPVGKSEHSLVYEGAICNDGVSPLDMSKAYIWNFDNYADQKVTFFVVKVWLED